MIDTCIKYIETLNPLPDDQDNSCRFNRFYEPIKSLLSGYWVQNVCLKIKICKCAHKLNKCE